MSEKDVVEMTILVRVNLDAIPGKFHTPEDAKESVEQIVKKALISRIPHYNPIVTVI